MSKMPRIYVQGLPPRSGKALDSGVKKAFHAANKKARASHYPKGVPAGKKWITMNGAHVLIDKEGVILSVKPEGKPTAFISEMYGLKRKDFKTEAAWRKATQEARASQQAAEQAQREKERNQVYFFHRGKKIPV